MDIFQNILIILIPVLALLDNRGITIINHWPVTVGLFAGLVMGNFTEAMQIAGTFQLMSLGVAALGGSSVPDYALATVVSIYLNARTGADIGTSIAVGLPVGILAINLEVLGRTLNSFVTEKSKYYLETNQFKKMQAINFVSLIFVAMQAFIPMIILIAFGPATIEMMINVLPAWVTNGLNIAGGLMPVIGIVMLIRYMPTKKYFWAVIVGYVMAAYLKLPILAISLIGFVLAVQVFKGKEYSNVRNIELQNTGVDFDE